VEIAPLRVDAHGYAAQTESMKNDSDRPSDRLVVRDGVPLLGSRCVDTRSGVRTDHKQLWWDVRQGIQWIKGKKARGVTPSVSDFKRAFQGTLLVADDGVTPRYATDPDIEGLIENPAQGPAKLAQALIAARLDLELSTIIRYTKRGKKAKAQKRTSKSTLRP
jgi:hypothetical protein